MLRRPDLPVSTIHATLRFSFRSTKKGIRSSGEKRRFRRYEISLSLRGIQPISCSMHDFNLLEKRPLIVSMKPDKLVKSTGLAIKDVKEVCRTLAKHAFEQLPSG